MQEFGEIAIQLAKNPLGIIALAFVLIYGIAGFLSRSPKFNEYDRKILVWFLVFFPCLVLAVFTYLVMFHHTKLYAPYDYTDERYFFGAEKGTPSEASPNKEIQPTQ